MESEFIDAVVAGFEDGSWPGKDWRHLHHLVIAVHYIEVDPDPLARLRTEIRRYNLSQGGKNTEDSGYHETLTRFWLEIVRAYMKTLPAGLTKAETVTCVCDELAPRRDLFRDYYSFDVVASRPARAAWIPPDQAPAGVTSIFPTPSA